jgi:flagellar biosynthesis protein FlhG
MMNQVTALSASKATGEVVANVIALASGKGGVGKTWLAITLADCLARAERRTLLFDGDLGLANIDIQLGLAPGNDLGGVLAGQYSLSEAVADCDNVGFQVIAGRSGSVSLASLPVSRLDALVDDLGDLAAGYHNVVLDLGAGIESTVRRLALRAGICLVVTNEEPTALTDAYAFIKLALRQNPKADLRVVINLASSTGEGQRTHAVLASACRNFLNTAPPLAAVIRRDFRVPDAIRHQVPLLTRHPMCEAAQDVERLARTLLETP